ncbi:MAG: hypothetical protein ACRD3C_17715 [Vicinamibacterales bacterium]
MRKWLVALLVLAAAIASFALLRVADQPVSSPRTQDDRPNLNGIWQVLNTAAWDIQDHQAQLGVPAGQGAVEGNDIPYQPWALAKKLENSKNRLTADLTDARGFLPGVPRMMYMPFPLQIVQTPKYITILSEYSRAVRIIYTDGSQHPEGPIDFWMGDSRGSWEGNTLVVDAIHFNDQTWFDKAGNFHSEALHLVERFTLAGPDHVNYEVIVEDPKVFTRPWKMSMPLYRRKERNVRILEYEAGMLLLEEEARRQDEQGRGR